MPIINVIIALAVIGFVMYAVNRWLPMASPYKKILNVVVLILVVLWLLSVFGVFSMNLGTVPRLRH